MNNLPLHRLEVELLSRRKENSCLEERWEEETSKGPEYLRQDVGDVTQSGSELASKTLKESEVQPLEAADVAEISEKVGTLQLAQEHSDTRAGATKEEVSGIGKSSLLDLYYGVSPTEREQETTSNGMLFVHGSE